MMFNRRSNQEITHHTLGGIVKSRNWEQFIMIMNEWTHLQRVRHGGGAASYQCLGVTWLKLTTSSRISFLAFSNSSFCESKCNFSAYTLKSLKPAPNDTFANFSTSFCNNIFFQPNYCTTCRILLGFGSQIKLLSMVSFAGGKSDFNALQCRKHASNQLPRPLTRSNSRKRG